jgi:hypothetical protein
MIASFEIISRSSFISHTNIRRHEVYLLTETLHNLQNDIRNGFHIAFVLLPLQPVQDER